MIKRKETKKDHFEKIAQNRNEVSGGSEFGAIIENKKENYPQTGSWRERKPEFNDKCIACGVCVGLCPEGIIEIKESADGKGIAKNKAGADFEFCKGCGICAEACPVEAIIMRGVN